MFEALLQLLAGAVLAISMVFGFVVQESAQFLQQLTGGIPDQEYREVAPQPYWDATDVHASTLPAPKGASTSERVARDIPMQKNPPVSQPSQVRVPPTPPAVASPPPASKVQAKLPAPVADEASLPGPLENSSSVVQYGNQLSADEIISLTNLERKANGLSLLSKNLQLTNMARAKTLDMIERQYFEHVSPTGVDISDLALQYGYRYLHVGENLALGDFSSSTHVVMGWMNSPGHRTNMLGKDFTEIGVYVQRGAWKGREVWWAVQEFGKPMPVCPTPDEAVRKKIEIYESQLETIKADLDKNKTLIDSASLPFETLKEKTSEYNMTVDLYNSFLREEKGLIALYNQQIAEYNSCITQ